VGIPLKEFPPVEWPDWDELAEYAASLVPKKVVSTSAGKGGQGGEDEEDPSAIEEEEDSPAPVGEAEAEPVARDDVQVWDVLSESEPSSEKTASWEAE